MYACRYCAGTGYTIRRIRRTTTQYRDKQTGRVLLPWDELKLGPLGRKQLIAAGKIEEIQHEYTELMADPSQLCKACRGRGRPQPERGGDRGDADHEGAAPAPLGLGQGTGHG